MTKYRKIGFNSFDSINITGCLKIYCKIKCKYLYKYLSSKFYLVKYSDLKNENKIHSPSVLEKVQSLLCFGFIALAAYAFLPSVQKILIHSGADA